MILTTRQQDILLHMTGLDRSTVQTRSYFAAEKDGADRQTLTELVTLGLVRQPVSGGEVFPDFDFFYTTTEGVTQATAIKKE